MNNINELFIEDAIPAYQKANSDSSKVKIGLVSLGCPKNACDAELMLSKLYLENSYTFVPEPGLADLVIINTCGFIEASKEEAIQEILEAAARKKDGINKKILITGCLAQRYKEELQKQFPEIDGAISIYENQNIVSIVKDILNNKNVFLFSEKDFENKIQMEGDRAITTLPSYAYLRIADGCSNKCSYCAIPSIRGDFISRLPENILAEAKKIVKDGTRELVLIAQDTTRYPDLCSLLRNLCKIPNLKWIRLLYCYPERITDELIKTIKEEEKILPYLDIPIQHCSSEILKKMNRPGNAKTLRKLISKIRKEIPDIILRTTVITGFPGETEKQFTELAEFLHEIDFDHLGCFEYSPEEDTPAASFPDQIDNEEKSRRRQIIEEQQEFRVSDRLEKEIGKVYEVVCEGFDRYIGCYFGRNYALAPEIDGMIYFTDPNQPFDESETIEENEEENSYRETPLSVPLYTYVKVKITDITENNLIGELYEHSK